MLSATDFAVREPRMSMEFNLSFEPEHGTGVPVTENVSRVTANNPSPFTFHGTNSYIVGSDTLAVIDPGPRGDQAHLEALLRVAADRPITHILITHTHVDHSPLAADLKARTGARTVGFGPHRTSQVQRATATVALDAGGDPDFVPDIVLADGETIQAGGSSFRAVHTPGHAANHLAFALDDTGLLFSGDHVMGWSTSIVAPPDGHMASYMASLDKLLARQDSLYLPGHGGPIAEPARFVRGLRTHRKMRERAIVERLSAGDRTIAEIVKAIYRDTDPRLHGAAALSVFAHMEDLVERDVVRAGAPLSLQTEYEVA